jgi:hypothetical protein
LNRELTIKNRELPKNNEILKPVNAVRELLDRTIALHMNSLSGSELNESTWIEFNRYLTEYTTQFPAEAAASVPFPPFPIPDQSTLLNAAELSQVQVTKSVNAEEFQSSMNQTPVAAQQSIVSSELKSVSKQTVTRKALSTTASATPSLKSAPARRPVASSSASVCIIHFVWDRRRASFILIVKLDGVASDTRLIPER